MDLTKADSRGLYEPLQNRLRTQSSTDVLAWLKEVLSSQSPALRASNSTLVAYTGCREAIDWLEQNVGSPVSDHWGVAAALLGTSWSQIGPWLLRGGPHQLMALDALIAYRSPAPNMSALHQIAAPVLPDPPELSELENVLAKVLASKETPRIRNAVSSIRKHAPEILGRNKRGVPVSELPKLYLSPETFQNSTEVLSRQSEVIGGIRKSIQDMLGRFTAETKK